MKDFYQQADKVIKDAQIGKLPKPQFVALRAAIESLQERAFRMGQESAGRVQAAPGEVVTASQ